MGMQIMPFAFEGNPIRVLEINNDPWFVAKDVAVALGYKNTRDALGRHCKRAQDVGGSVIATPSDLDPQTKIIPEGDVYRLIVRSNRPEAEKFESLIMDEILPTIRKTGSYGAPTKVDYNDPALQLGLIEHLRVEAETAKARVIELTPKAEAYEAYLSEEGVCRIMDFCNKHGVKKNHPGYVLRDRGLMHQKKVLATQIGLKSGILKNVLEKNGFEYIDSKGQSVEAQLGMIVRQREASLLKMIINAYGMTAFRNSVAFDRAKSLIGGAA